MFAKLTQHRTFVFCAVAALAVGLIVAGCNLFESKSSPTLPQADAPQANYIVGGAEDSGWTAYYTPGDTYFKLTIPVVGVIKIHYTVIQGVQTGSTFTLVLKTTAPTTHEIGLKTFEVDGKSITDVVDCVWVEYVENGDFASMPANAKIIEVAGKQYVHYEREAGDSETEKWWSYPAEEFVFLTDATHIIQTMKPYCQQQLLVDEGKPAQRPVTIPANVCTTPSGPLPGSVTYSGRTWYSGTLNTSCNEVCAKKGMIYNTTDQAFSQNSTYCQGLGKKFYSGGSYTEDACPNQAGCHYYDGSDGTYLCTNGIDPDWKATTDCQYCACDNT